MSKVAKTIENHKNIIQSTSSTVASIGLTQAGKKVAGILVTPAVWVLNYSAQGSKPDAIDVGLYATGFLGSIGSVAAISTGIIKAVVDDDVDNRLREVQNGEDPRYRVFIKSCSRYASMAPQINAMTIASKGGTAWKHTNGLWVYITDARGYLVNDYKPKSAIETFRPKHPLLKSPNGGLVWERIR